MHNRPTEAEVRGLMVKLLDYQRRDEALHAFEMPDVIALCEDWLRLNADSRYAELGKGLFEAMDMAKAVRNAEELHNLDRTDAFIQVWTEQKRRIEELETKLAATTEPPHA